MDSFTLLHYVLRLPGPSIIRTIGFDYGQRNRKELNVAAKVCAELGVERIVVDLTSLRPLLATSALTNPDLETPIGYNEEKTAAQVIVPGRNTIMLAIAMGIAESALKGGDTAVVYYGTHSGSRYTFPDCRPEFFESMREVFSDATEGRVVLEAPFLWGSKTTILQAGKAMGLDYGKTWSCYSDADQPCRKCGACQERAASFAAIGMLDPLIPIFQAIDTAIKPVYANSDIH
jgi:7-cyano-7-deazaguanine synthase